MKRETVWIRYSIPMGLAGVWVQTPATVTWPVRQRNGCTMRRHALFLVNPACLVAAIAFVYLPGCSPNPQGPRTNPNPQGVDSDDMYQFSSSIAEAKKRGTLISEVEIIPNVWNYAGKEITFEEAWLERMPKAYFARPFALCIRINQGKG